MYKGGKWLGIDNIKLADGKLIKPDDIVEEMPEQEAKDRMGFDPIYEGRKLNKKEVDEDA